MPNEITAGRLRAEVARAHITQQKLADRLGRSQPWVWRRLSGEVEPTVGELHEIAQALGIPAGQLLADEPV